MARGAGTGVPGQVSQRSGRASTAQPAPQSADAHHVCKRAWSRDHHRTTQVRSTRPGTPEARRRGQSSE